MSSDVRINRIIIDWCAFTVHQLTVDEVFILLGLENSLGSFQNMNGHDGYKDRLFFNGISVFFNGHDNQGIHVSMSGQGCRAFETYSDYGDFHDLLSSVLSLEKSKISRLDVAYDDFNGCLPINTIADCVRFGNWTSPAGCRWWEVNLSSVGTSVYLGSPQSRLRIRFYDKAAEQKVEYMWNRCEIQLRDEQATQFTKEFIINSDISRLYFGVINNYVRFIDRSTDSNVSRCKMYEWWQEFLQTTDKVKLWSPGVTYNIGRLKQNVEERWGNAIQTYISLFGVFSLQQSLNTLKPVSDLPVQYKKMLIEYIDNFRSNERIQEVNLGDFVIEEVKDLPKKFENVMSELEGLK